MGKERPILFSGPMVQAILDGRKTQARWVIKPQPFRREYPEGLGSLPPGNYWVAESHGNLWYGFVTDEEMTASLNNKSCPYGQPGDRLWVRETAIIGPKNSDDKLLFTTHKDDDGDKRHVQYLASNPHRDWAKAYGLKATPPRFMPRWTSRIILEVTAVRVERVQDISEDDAMAEGMEIIPIGTATRNNRQSFQILWDSINGETYPWKSNPFVWVVEFKVQK